MNAALLCFAALVGAEPASPEDRAKAFVSLLEKAQFTEAVKSFDPAMTKALSADELQNLWKGVVAQVGAIEKQLNARSERTGTFTIAYVTCKFQKATLDVKVVFDAERKVAGLNFIPVHNKDLYPPPTYARPDAFKETEVKLGQHDWMLPGTLTMPKGNGPFPGVVLVHGSGPQDRDSTIGRIKPFRDLAWGLATRGIAVIRYEKRTKEHPLKIAPLTHFTVHEETIEDALAAAEFLRQTPGIDPKRIVVIGHSLGGLVGPRIGLADPKLAGLVLLAAPTRALEEVMLEQAQRALAAKEKLAPAEIQFLEALQRASQLIKEGKIANSTPRKDLMGLSAAYWKSVCGFSTAAEAKRYPKPILVLHGETDVQVTMADFAGWKKESVGQTNITCKSYPKLGHLFTVSDGKGDPAEYARPANISLEVVSDIAAWVLRLR